MMNRAHLDLDLTLEPPLIINRDEARRLLGSISALTIQKFERQGRLNAVKMTNSQQGRVFYSYAEVVALAQSLLNGE